jgi:hypothetical protein
MTIPNVEMQMLTARIGVGICCILCLAGCGSRKTEYPAARLAGSVTIAGTPIAVGRVHFMPNAGTHGTPVTAEIAAGNYVADSVPLGNVTVTFSAAKETGNLVREANREPYPEFVSIIPAQYSEGIPLNVTGDNDAQNFSLITGNP